MIFDTDVLIWALRGNTRAASAINRADDLQVSIVSYMELIQGARNKRELHATQKALAELEFEILPLSENIGHRASIYMEEYALKSNIGLADALIAATAIEKGLTLCTANTKDYKAISEISLKAFRP